MNLTVWPALVRVIAKHPWLALAALPAITAIGAAIVIVSGVVAIKASSGHWAITAWLLDFAKLRSVSTYSLGVTPPPLDDETLVIRGASHYEGGCAPCHGRPGTDVPPVMAAMTPDPPKHTADALGRYTPEELFVIVKHGIKFTGMPAWPTQERDDEVWAVVALLGAMPRLDAERYLRLAYGEPATGESSAPAAGVPRPVREICWRCHGTTGRGRDDAFPSLAGQRADYLYLSLRAYATRQRFSGIMTPVAARLGDDAMREVARYYESVPAREGEGVADTATIAGGASIARSGVPARDIPACAECHGPVATPRNPAYPRLDGQHRGFLTRQLELLKQRRRGGSANVNLMHAFVDRLDSAQIASVTAYYAAGAP